MKCEKLGISVAFLSALAFFFGWYSLTIAAVIAVGVICVSKNEVLRKNVLNAFVLSICFTVVTFILSKISGGYINIISKIYGLSWEWLSKIFTYNVYSVFMKLDLCYYLIKILSFVEFVLMIVFVIIAAKGKEIKIPLISSIVNKALNGTEKKEEPVNPMTSEEETLTDIPR